MMTHCAFMGYFLVRGSYKIYSINKDLYEKDKLYFASQQYYDNLLKVSSYLNISNGRIENKDYSLILKEAKKGDFVFLDPPYIEDHDYKFSYNNKESINDDFINRLLYEYG